MEKIIKSLVEYRKFTIFIALIILLMGAICFYQLPRQEYPDVTAPAAMIITPYPGASAEEVDALVSSKIEEKLMEINGFEKSRSTSKDSVSVVIIEFDINANTDKVMQDVRNKVADLKSILPDGALNSVINTDLTETAGILISLSGENYDYSQLDSFANQFKDKLIDINGIRKFEITGELKKEVKVELDIEKLNKLDISVGEVYTVLKAQNVKIPQGSIDTETVKIPVDTNGRYESIQDIGNTVIAVSRENGTITKLSDIAEIYMDLEEGTPKFKQNGENAVILTGYFLESENIVNVGKDVRKAIDEVKSNLPPDLIATEIIYQPTDVNHSTNDFLINAIEGIVLVVIVMFFGMGLRNAITVSFTIPIVMFLTFIIMSILGIKIHQMSLVGLIMALGALVDNAIVVSDAINTRMNDGEDKITASYKGASFMAVAIFGATITTVLSFVPLTQLQGVVGDFVRAIPLVFIISIISSYFVALFIIPAFAGVLFKKSNKEQKDSKIKGWFISLFDRALKRRWIVLAGSFVILIVVIKTLIPTVEFFPYAEKDYFSISVNSEKLGNINETERLIDSVSSILADEPEFKSITSATGSGFPKYFTTSINVAESADIGQIIYKFDLAQGSRFKDEGEYCAYLQNLIEENVSGGVVQVNRLALSIPGAEISLRLTGDDIGTIKNVKKQLKEEIAKLEGITNLKDNMGDSTYGFKVNIDEVKALARGFTKQDIQQQIMIAVRGISPSVFMRDSKEYDIFLHCDITDVRMLENLYIKSSLTADKIPLKEIVTIKLDKKTGIFNRYNNKKSITIEANTLPGYNAAELTNEIEFNILPNIDSEGVHVRFEGERANISKYFGNAISLAILSMFLIYLVLCLQFKSFSQAMIIMVTIPLSLIGSIIGLRIFNKSLSLTALLGIIALAGIVVNNGILLIEYMNIARKDGASLEDACRRAIDQRFKPIMLTAITTVSGLIPLALGNSSLFSPMAITLMGGLIASTFLTTFIVPIIYVVVGTAGKRQPAIQESTFTRS